VEVTGAVGTIGEELFGGTMLGVGSRGSENGRRRLALLRSSRQSEEKNGGECGAEAVVARCGGRKRRIALAPARFYRRSRWWTPMAQTMGGK
jgi:hypothetical protein